MLPNKRVAAWRLALSSLRQNIPVILLYVVDSKGSSPGRAGFFMVVNAAGEVEGSIGGGIMEYKFMEMARDLLRQGKPVLSVRRQVHDKEAVRDQSGMICSGEQTIVLYSLRGEDAEMVEGLVDSLSGFRNGWLKLSPFGLEFFTSTPVGAIGFAVLKEGWVYLEKTGYVDRLFIVGGGHCALALSWVMRSMDFYISLFDDRSELGSLVQNEYVHEKIVVKDYGELSALIQAGPHSYVVVMTQGYRTDDKAVRALLPMDFRYFGLLGSRAKIDQMLAGYRMEGIGAEKLGRLRAPAGLAIHSQTPEEIAVSIAAEIIQVRRGVR